MPFVSLPCQDSLLSSSFESFGFRYQFCFQEEQQISAKSFFESNASEGIICHRSLRKQDKRKRANSYGATAASLGCSSGPQEERNAESQSQPATQAVFLPKRLHVPAVRPQKKQTCGPTGGERKLEGRKVIGVTSPRELSSPLVLLISACIIIFHLIVPFLTSSHLISSHLISSHFTSSYLILSYLLLCHLILLLPSLS